MTATEYGSMENQAMIALQQLREKGVGRDDIGILMSREVYDMARLWGNSAYAVSVENFRALYWGYDIYVIAENSPQMFSPVIVRFLEDFDFSQFDQGTFLISESDDGSLRVYTKPTQEHTFFCETEFTVRQARQTDQVTFADRIRSGRERERLRHPPAGWEPRLRYESERYASVSPEFGRVDWTRYFPDIAEEFRRRLSETEVTVQRESMKAAPRKKTPPQKDWDERITPEDTKELDEFLNSLARRCTLESAT